MRPRVGFLGIGWIGRNRMEAMLDIVEPVAVADPDDEAVFAALSMAPGAQRVRDLDEMLACGVDGLAIATPSAFHAAQAIEALEGGAAVFCQKPLGRTEHEVRSVLAAARRANRLLAVDFCYRHAAAVQQLAETIRAGRIGRIYAADLVFHNAYGPDKPWFYERGLSGGGCVMDLGVHLVDLSLWLMDWPQVEAVESSLFTGGARLTPNGVEDFAVATLTTATGAVVRLACSWRLPAGQDAVIGVEFYGTEGGVSLRNINGSFFDFEAYEFRGTSRRLVAAPPDAWGGRAARSWARRLAQRADYEEETETVAMVARVVDRIYGAADRARAKQMETRPA